MTKDKNKPVTMKDIALKAGVSIDAVSKALRDCNDISLKKKEEIKKIAKELGYIPNIVAQNLKSGTSNTIALVFNDFYNPYFSVFCSKVFEKLNEKGYKCQIIYSTTPEMTMKDIHNIMINNFCGIISFVEPTDEVAAFFRQRHLPFTLIGIKSSNPDIDCIYTDDFSGGMQVAEYFINSSYTNALYISNSSSETSKRRQDGFTSFCNEYSKNFYCLIPDEYSVQKACCLIKEKEIDFVFCFSDALAVSLKRELKEEKYQKKIKIVGFDNLYKYYPFMQKIDSVSSNMEEIIDFACNKTIQKIINELSIDTHISKMFPTHLSIKK
jgi:LacI family transcriptional regulator